MSSAAVVAVVRKSRDRHCRRCRSRRRRSSRRSRGCRARANAASSANPPARKADEEARVGCGVAEPASRCCRPCREFPSLLKSATRQSRLTRPVSRCSRGPLLRCPPAAMLPAPSLWPSQRLDAAVAIEVGERWAGAGRRPAGRSAAPSAANSTGVAVFPGGTVPRWGCRSAPPKASVDPCATPGARVVSMYHWPRAVDDEIGRAVAIPVATSGTSPGTPPNGIAMSGMPSASYRSSQMPSR